MVKIIPFRYVDNRTKDPKREDWMDWRDAYLRAVRANRWDDETARLALAGHMIGVAGATITDIDPMDYGCLADLLVAYDARFLPPASSQLARQRFDVATQLAKEPELLFHTRLRTLHSRAFPGALDEVHLIRRFVTGLNTPAVQRQVLRINPRTYRHALEVAQNERAVVNATAVAQSRVPPPGRSAPEDLFNLAGESRCHECQEVGHFRRNCPVFLGNKNKGAALRQPRGAPGRGGRGGAARGGGTGRAGRLRPILAALEAEAAADEAEEQGTEQDEGEPLGAEPPAEPEGYDEDESDLSGFE